jgi:uncharacterized membrane protein YfhO
MEKKGINKKTRQTKINSNKHHDFELFKNYDSYTEKYGIYIFLFLLFLIAFIVFKDFIFLNKTYLFKDIGSDTITEGYPTLYSLADYITKEGFPKWSFNQGMGQNFFPVGAINPFSLFVVLMGKDNVYFTIFFAELFKILFAGLFFYLFLQKLIKSNYIAIIGCILYSFSGFIILGGQWEIFSTQAVYIALLLYSFEKLYQDNNWILFPVSIFLISSNHPFDLYLIGLFLIIYVIFRLFEENERKPKKIFLLLARLFILGVLGIAISSFFLINGIQIMLESPRGSGDVSYSNSLMSRPVFGLLEGDNGKTHYLTAFMRFFSNDILGCGDNFMGWVNYFEAPLFYCGLISLILLPHFLSGNDRRKKIIYSVFVLIFFLPVIFPFFRYSFYLFTGDYYRTFSFFVALAVLIVSLKSIDIIYNRPKISIIIIIATLLVLLCFLYYPYPVERIIDKKIRGAVTNFLIIYSVIIYAYQFKAVKNIVKTVLLIVIVVELISLSDAAVNKRPVITGAETKQKIGYNDYTVDAVKYLKSIDSNFFRINKKYYSGLSKSSSYNDGLVQDYFGISSYSSFNQLYYIKFLQEVQFIKGQNEYQTRWSEGFAGAKPWFQTFASVKYTLFKTTKPLLKDPLNDSIKTIGDIKIMKNKCTLPLGYTYDKYINYKDFRKLSQTKKCVALYSAFVVDSINSDKVKSLNVFPVSGISNNYLLEELERDIAVLKKDTFVIKKFSQNNIKGEINLNNKKMLFFTIPFDKGWKAVIDGKTETPLLINIGFMGLFLDKGTHNIELSYLPPLYTTGAYISLISLVVFILIIAIKFLLRKKQLHKY